MCSFTQSERLVGINLCGCGCLFNVDIKFGACMLFCNYHHSYTVGPADESSHNKYDGQKQFITL